MSNSNSGIAVGVPAGFNALTSALYATIRDCTGKWMVYSTGALETYSAIDLASYIIALAEIAPLNDVAAAPLPTALIAGDYILTVYQHALGGAANPASDAQVSQMRVTVAPAAGAPVEVAADSVAAIAAAVPTPLTAQQVQGADAAAILANPAATAASIAAAVVAALPQSSGGGGSSLTTQQITAAVLAALAAQETPVQIAAPPCGPQSVYAVTVGDRGIGSAITDTLYDLDGNLIDLTTVSAVHLVADVSEGAGDSITVPAVINSNGTVTHTWAAGELTTQQDYAWVRWICTTTSGGQITAQGARWRSISVQAAP